MKILVTGATGFIDRAIVRELKAQGHEVTALVRKTSKIDDHLPDSRHQKTPLHYPNDGPITWQ